VSHLVDEDLLYTASAGGALTVWGPDSVDDRPTRKRMHTLALGCWKGSCLVYARGGDLPGYRLLPVAAPTDAAIGSAVNSPNISVSSAPAVLSAPADELADELVRTKAALAEAQSEIDRLCTAAEAAPRFGAVVGADKTGEGRGERERERDGRVEMEEELRQARSSIEVNSTGIDVLEQHVLALDLAAAQQFEPPAAPPVQQDEEEEAPFPPVPMPVVVPQTVSTQLEQDDELAPSPPPTSPPSDGAARRAEAAGNFASPLLAPQGEAEANMTPLKRRILARVKAKAEAERVAQEQQAKKVDTVDPNSNSQFMSTFGFATEDEESA
jgi:hypothetical protein